MAPTNTQVRDASAGLTSLKLCAAALGLLILIEFALRVVVGLGNPVLYQTDSACGYLARPNQHIRRFLARTDINSYGLRCPEFKREKPAGAIRLMFLGDSITYGTTRVDQNDIFVELVRKHLSTTSGRNIEEVNASANAWAISNEHGYLRSRGTYNSDYVIVVLNSGDLAQPFSSLSEVREGVTVKPTSAVGELISRTLFRKVKQDAGTAIGADLPQQTSNLGELSSMAALARASAGRFAVVFVPFRRVIAENSSASAPPVLRRWSSIEHVPLLDLTAAISHYEIEKITLPDRTHFNKLGNQALACSLERQLSDLLRTSLFPKASTQRGFTP